MRNLFSILLVVISSINLFAQNLVPNASFEDTVSCPTTANQLYNCAYWNVVSNTPDYFNGCDFITGNSSTPSNFAGFQYAATGVAYVGFFTFSTIVPNEREVISCSLLTPLIVGQKYDLSFKVSWSGSIATIANNKMGFFFSNQLYTQTSSFPIQNSAQFFTNTIVSDSVNWTSIFGSYIPDSNYSYLYIGNLFDDANTDTIQFQPVTSYAYYYIDDIVVELDSTTGISYNIENSRFSLGPNPVISEFTINNLSQNSFIVNIYDIRSSKCFLSQAYSQKKVKINLSHLTKGIYICKISYDLNKNYFYKIIKI